MIILDHTELAAEDWFSRMTKREQRAYIQAHPRSRYAKKMGGSPSGTRGAPPSGKRMMSMSRKFDRLGAKYDRLGSKSVEDAGRHRDAGNKLHAQHHRRVGALRNQSADHFQRAAEHYRNGDHQRGSASAEKARGLARQSKELRASFRSAVGGTSPKSKPRGALRKEVRLTTRPSKKSGPIRIDAPPPPPPPSRKVASDGDVIGHFTKTPSVKVRVKPGKDKVTGKPTRHVHAGPDGGKHVRLISSVNPSWKVHHIVEHLKKVHHKIFGQAGGVTWHHERKPDAPRPAPKPAHEPQADVKKFSSDMDANVKRYHDHLRELGDHHAKMRSDHAMASTDADVSSRDADHHRRASEAHGKAADAFHAAHRAFTSGGNGSAHHREAEVHRRNAITHAAHVGHSAEPNPQGKTRRLHQEHSRQARHHEKQASVASSPRGRDAHLKAMHAHDDASRHYAEAERAYSHARPDEGRAHHATAREKSERAKQLSERARTA